MAKHMRLPNGFGQISKIKKPLRNPYRAMVSVGINPDTGHTISKTVGYYKTYNDAYAALMEYHNNPYDLQSGIVTLNDLHEKWYEEWSKNVKKSTITAMNCAWRRASIISSMNIKDIRPSHIKSCMDQAPTVPTKNNVKILFNIMMDYAIEYDLVEHNYSRNFSYKADKSVKEAHIAFTDEEIEILWQNANINQIARMMLIQCYMGWRPQELCNLLIKNININTWTITGGMKTKSGINRTVPIPDVLKPLIEKEYNSNNSFLFVSPNGARINYKIYYDRFDTFVTTHGLNIKHRPHDGRKTFVTRAKRKGLNEYAIKYIVGHTISDITEKIYTERDPEWLRKEINLV